MPGIRYGLGHVHRLPGLGLELQVGSVHHPLLGHVGDAHLCRLRTRVLHQDPGIEGAASVAACGALGQVPGIQALVLDLDLVGDRGQVGDTGEVAGLVPGLKGEVIGHPLHREVEGEALHNHFLDGTRLGGKGYIIKLIGPIPVIAVYRLIEETDIVEEGLPGLPVVSGSGPVELGALQVLAVLDELRGEVGHITRPPGVRVQASCIPRVVAVLRPFRHVAGSGIGLPYKEPALPGTHHYFPVAVAVEVGTGGSGHAPAAGELGPSIRLGPGYVESMYVVVGAADKDLLGAVGIDVGGARGDEEHHVVHLAREGLEEAAVLRTPRRDLVV